MRAFSLVLHPQFSHVSHMNKSPSHPLRTIEWVAHQNKSLVPGHIRLIDQTRLPETLEYLETTDITTMWQAIQSLQVRGAPAIGIAAAMAIAAAAAEGDRSISVPERVRQAAAYITTSRPTAVNLFWAAKRMIRCAEQHANLPPDDTIERLVQEACLLRDEDAAMCRAIGRHGADLLSPNDGILTHCNAGGLATAEFGTALAPLYTAHERGIPLQVYADETRPLLQGARLTTWELNQAGIPVTLICDNMAAQVMKEGRIQHVMVGADRIAANGDAANKIGTYGVALLAHAHHIPFYVLAPTSTIDLTTATGSDIPIEQRSAEEITCGFGCRTAPKGIHVYAPAFDVTPAALITAIICQHGRIQPPFNEGLRKVCQR